MAITKPLRALVALRFIFKKGGTKHIRMFKITGGNDKERQASLDKAQEEIINELKKPGIKYLMTSFIWKE